MIPSEKVSSIPHGRLASLDGMRGVAALMVALYHWGLATSPIAQPGYLAVDFFFALSGYVLALIYAQRMESGSLDARKFITLRIIRFYPIYFVGHCLGALRNVALQLSDNPNAKTGIDWLLALVFGLFMLPVPAATGNLFPLNVPAWTLFLELAVNIVFAFGMFRWSNWVLGLIMALSAAVLVLFTSPPLLFDVGYSVETLLLGVARLGFSFPVGIILFRLMRGVKREQSFLALLPIAILAACLFFEAPEAYRGIWESVCVFILFPTLLAAGIKYELPDFAAPVFLFLGAVSYAIYAIHGPMILFVQKGVATAGLPFLPGLIVFLAILLAAAHLVTRYFDGPVRAAINGWRARKQAP